MTLLKLIMPSMPPIKFVFAKPIVSVTEDQEGVKVFIATWSAFTTGVYRVADPNDLSYEFAYADELEKKLIHWVKIDKVHLGGSDWMAAWMSACMLIHGASELDYNAYEAWWREMGVKCGYKG